MRFDSRNAVSAFCGKALSRGLHGGILRFVRPMNDSSIGFASNVFSFGTDLR